MTDMKGELLQSGELIEIFLSAITNSQAERSTQLFAFKRPTFVSEARLSRPILNGQGRPGNTRMRPITPASSAYSHRSESAA